VVYVQLSKLVPTHVIKANCILTFWRLTTYLNVVPHS